MGPDSIPPAVLKYCSPALALHMSIYFNMLLENGTFPANFKLYFAVPIFKSGSKEYVANYRPIAIQSVLAKIFESLVLDKFAIDLKHVIVSEQHGFRSRKLTSNNLMLPVLHNYVTSAYSTQR